MLQEFLRTGSDGWALALTSVRDLFAEGDLHADEVGGDFAAESERLGLATAEVHAAMAQALPTALADADRSGRLAELDARAARGGHVSPSRHWQCTRPTIAAAFDALAHRSRASCDCSACTATCTSVRCCAPTPAGCCSTSKASPARRSPTRTALSSPLRDVAGMLRSFDYAARYLLADASRHREPSAQAGSSTTARPSGRNATATRSATATPRAAGRDPRDDEVLLRAFELDKAVYEVVYEARNRPNWVRIPLGSIERLVAA